MGSKCKMYVNYAIGLIILKLWYGKNLFISYRIYFILKFWAGNCSEQKTINFTIVCPLKHLNTDVLWSPR
jgi:hypothetical protein